FLTERGRELGADADDCASSIAVARMGPSALSLLPEATASPARRSIASVPRSRRLELAELHPAWRALRRDVACGVVGHGSAVVVDDLEVVPVGVQDEGAVVARVVDGALAGTPVVLEARGERGGVERAHGHVVLRREGDVDVRRK